MHSHHQPGAAHPVAIRGEITKRLQRTFFSGEVSLLGSLRCPASHHKAGLKIALLVPVCSLLSEIAGCVLPGFESSRHCLWCRWSSSVLQLGHVHTLISSGFQTLPLLPAVLERARPVGIDQEGDYEGKNQLLVMITKSGVLRQMYQSYQPIFCETSCA